jgi:hypothetical protein
MYPDGSPPPGQVTSGGPPYGPSGPSAPLLAYPVNRIPDDEPLVLRPRVGRFLLVISPLYLGLPVAVALVLVGLMATLTSISLWDALTFAGLGLAVAVVIGVVQCGVMVAVGMSGGPWLAAGPAGIWIRARRRSVRAVFLPWPVVARIYRRRSLFEEMVFVQAINPQPGVVDPATFARIDIGVQRALFRAGLSASPFYCGRRVDEVLAELHRISGGRVRIG